MLDPGRYFAEAIYFLQYTLAQILWAIDRAALSIAVIAESANSWVTDNVAYFVQLLVNALSAPLGGMFILALTALGLWYALNNVLPTNRWVDPSKLATYALIAFFFFSSPIVVIDLMEELRGSLTAGIDQSLLDGATGDIFDTGMNGTDPGLPGAIPDVDGDGAAGSFDLVAAFMLVANLDELDSSEFPVDFEAAYFPFGDPSGIDLGDEADQELAKALASDGIERLVFAFIAIPTAIAEYFLRLVLTGVAMFLYAGVPFAMLFAFFNYTQTFLAAYLRQYINLLIETLMSVIIAAVMISLLAAAAVEGIGLYIGASIITLIVLLWRIKSALRLGTAAFDLFGGGALTGGSSGMDMANMVRQAVTGAVTLAGAAVTGGTTAALAGGAVAAGAALQADGAAGGAYLGTDPAKTEGRVQQLKAITGYAAGRSETVRSVIEGAHEARTLTRNFKDGEAQSHEPDTLDFLRAGSSMSGSGSSPWTGMLFSPSLRAAYDQIGGRRNSRSLLDDVYDESGEPVGAGYGRAYHSAPSGSQTNDTWRNKPATLRQRAYLRDLEVDIPEDLTRGQASDLIDRAGRQQRGQIETADEVRPGGRGSAERMPADQFAALEQALAALTEALTNGEGIGRQPDETINGPIPDWLQEDGRKSAGDASPNVGTASTSSDTDKDEVQNVNIVSAAPDLDRDGREDKYETTEPVPVPTGAVRLEPYQDSRRRVIDDTLARLEDPQSLAGQAAYKTLQVYAGERNANLIQQAVGQHTTGAVQQAIAATADLAAGYRARGLDDTAVLAAFQSGEAAVTIRENLAAEDLDVPLSDEQLSAVADMVLLPQRRFTRTELVTIIGQEVAAGEDSEQAVVDAIGSPVSFGGQTGNVRGVMAGARAMNLSPAEMARLATLIGDGLRDAVQAELAGRGWRPDVVQEFVSDLTALPGAIVVPQTTAFSEEDK
jgi:hypothetical protein